MERKICCFTGHSALPADQVENIYELFPGILEKLYSQGVREFRAGGALGFDTLAALFVLSFKENHPDVRLSLMLPCRDQDRAWDAKDREVYNFILKSADSVMYTADVYTKNCMFQRNRSLVNGSDICVCFVARSTGGSAYTYDYALSKGLEIINLYDIINKRN
jgi:uncharacterized phage-like protein YoqJ